MREYSAGCGDPLFFLLFVGTVDDLNYYLREALENTDEMKKNCQ